MSSSEGTLGWLPMTPDGTGVVTDVVVFTSVGALQFAVGAHAPSRCGPSMTADPTNLHTSGELELHPPDESRVVRCVPGTPLSLRVSSRLCERITVLLGLALSGKVVFSFYVLLVGPTDLSR